RQVDQVALQLLAVAVLPGRADDEAQARGRLQVAHDVAQAAARLLVGDLARDADAVEPGHQDQVAAGDADVGREGRALGADALLDDLDEHLVAAAEDLLDRGLDQAPSAARAPGPGRLVAPSRSRLD